MRLIPESKEEFLRDVFSKRIITKDPAAQSIHRTAVLPIDLGQRLRITVDNSRDEINIRRNRESWGRCSTQRHRTRPPPWHKPGVLRHRDREISVVFSLKRQKRHASTPILRSKTDDGHPK